MHMKGSLSLNKYIMDQCRILSPSFTTVKLTCILCFLQGFYDRGKDLSWRTIKDIQAVAAMGPTGGARNPVDPRFLSLFHVYEVSAPSLQTQRTIFNTILDVQLTAFPADVRGIGTCTASAEVFGGHVQTSLPTSKRIIQEKLTSSHHWLAGGLIRSAR